MDEHPGNVAFWPSQSLLNATRVARKLRGCWQPPFDTPEQRHIPVARRVSGSGNRSAWGVSDPRDGARRLRAHPRRARRLTAHARRDQASGLSRRVVARGSSQARRARRPRRGGARAHEVSIGERKSSSRRRLHRRGRPAPRDRARIVRVDGRARQDARHAARRGVSPRRGGVAQPRVRRLRHRRVHHRGGLPGLEGSLRPHAPRDRHEAPRRSHRTARTIPDEPLLPRASTRRRRRRRRRRLVPPAMRRGRQRGVLRRCDAAHRRGPRGAAHRRRRAPRARRRSPSRRQIPIDGRRRRRDGAARGGDERPRRVRPRDHRRPSRHHGGRRGVRGCLQGCERGRRSHELPQPVCGVFAHLQLAGPGAAVAGAQGHRLERAHRRGR